MTGPEPSAIPPGRCACGHTLDEHGGLVGCAVESCRCHIYRPGAVEPRCHDDHFLGRDGVRRGFGTGAPLGGEPCPEPSTVERPLDDRLHVSEGDATNGYPCPKDGAVLTPVEGGFWCPTCHTAWLEVGEFTLPEPTAVEPEGLNCACDVFPGAVCEAHQPSAVEPGSQDTEALVRLRDAAMDPAGYWEERAATAEAALAAARADLATSDSALGIANERVLNAGAENAALRADVDRLTARVRLEADVNDRLAAWQEQAEADLAVLRGQRDAALALCDEIDQRYPSTSDAWAIRRALGGER